MPCQLTQQLPHFSTGTQKQDGRLANSGVLYHPQHPTADTRVEYLIREIGIAACDLLCDEFSDNIWFVNVGGAMNVLALAGA